MEYIVRAEEQFIPRIKEIFNVTWESEVLKGLIFIESGLSDEELSKIEGIISCREGRVGTFNV